MAPQPPLSTSPAPLDHAPAADHQPLQATGVVSAPQEEQQSPPTHPPTLDAPTALYPPAPPLNSSSSGGLATIRQDPMEPDDPVRSRNAAPQTSYEPVPHSQRSLSAYMARHPTHSVKKAIRTLYPRDNCFVRLGRRCGKRHSVIKGLTDDEMQRWEAAGPELRRKAGWKLPGEEGPGVEVSELFWKMYLSIQPTIEHDKLSGMTAPDLIGSTTTMPLSIVSLIPDIMQHYRSVIIRAQKEVFLATNYWQ